MASLASTTILPHRQPPLQNPDNNKDNLRLSQSRTLLIVLADTEEREEKENKVPEAPRKAECLPETAHTLYAQWEANNYTVTLNVNGGDALPTNVFTVTYGQPYNCLPNASRTGRTFLGWFTNKTGGIEVTSETRLCLHMCPQPSIQCVVLWHKAW